MHYFEVTFPNLKTGQTWQQASFFDRRLFTEAPDIPFAELFQVSETPARYVQRGLVEDEELFDALVSNIRDVPGGMLVRTVRNVKTASYAFELRSEDTIYIDTVMGGQSLDSFKERHQRYVEALSRDLKQIDDFDSVALNIEPQLYALKYQVNGSVSGPVRPVLAARDRIRNNRYSLRVEEDSISFS